MFGLLLPFGCGTKEAYSPMLLRIANAAARRAPVVVCPSLCPSSLCETFLAAVRGSLMPVCPTHRRGGVEMIEGLVARLPGQERARPTGCNLFALTLPSAGLTITRPNTGHSRVGTERLTILLGQVPHRQLPQQPTTKTAAAALDGKRLRQNLLGRQTENATSGSHRVELCQLLFLRKIGP